MVNFKKLVLVIYVEIMLLLATKMYFTLLYKNDYVEPLIYYMFIYIIAKAIRYH